MVPTWVTTRAIKDELHVQKEWWLPAHSITKHPHHHSIYVCAEVAKWRPQRKNLNCVIFSSERISTRFRTPVNTFKWRAYILKSTSFSEKPEAPATLTMCSSLTVLQQWLSSTLRQDARLGPHSLLFLGIWAGNCCLLLEETQAGPSHQPPSASDSHFTANVNHSIRTRTHLDNDNKQAWVSFLFVCFFYQKVKCPQLLLVDWRGKMSLHTVSVKWWHIQPVTLPSITEVNIRMFKYHQPRSPNSPCWAFKAPSASMKLASTSQVTDLKN